MRGKIQLPQLPQLHAAPSGSAAPRGSFRSNRGLGKRITADHSTTSVGKRPTEKLTQAVQALLSPANTPACLCPVACADFSQPCCTPRHPRGRALRSGYFISIAVHFCGPASAGIFQPPTNHTICHSASQSWLPVSREVLITERPSTSDLSLLEMPVSPFPPFSGHRARVALTSTVLMLVLVVRLSRHVGPSVARCPSACPVFAHRDYHELRTCNSARGEDGSREGCQAERGPDGSVLGHPFQASRPESKLPSRAGCQPAYSITLPLACKSPALSRLQNISPAAAAAAPPPPPPPQMMEIANHAAYSTPRILAMRGAEHFRILEQLHEGRLDRAQLNDMSHLRTTGSDYGTKAALCPGRIIFPSLTGHSPD